MGGRARKDAALTHPNPVCLDANALFTMVIAHAVKTCLSPYSLYRTITEWATDLEVEPTVMAAIQGAADTPPADFVRQQGWVLIAFGNALWQLIHAPGLEAGVVDTVMRGGDTDTNAAICGALMGAVYGIAAIPAQWMERVLDCRLKAGNPGVHRPWMECFWPIDALELAQRLIT